jgi:hypothetical protein
MLYENIRNNFNTKLKIAYRNYFTKQKVYELIKQNSANVEEEKKAKSFYESLVFNRIKKCSIKCTGYTFFDDNELQSYEPTIYHHLPYIRDIINIINDEINELPILKTTIRKTQKYFVYNKLKFTRDDRINFLYTYAKNNLLKYNKKITIAKKLVVLLLLRYCTLGISGQQCSLSFDIYNYMYNNMNVKGEGFCSPLNSKLIEKNDSVICSVFEDIDKYFKSRGLYTKEILEKNSDINWLLNPPFLTSAIKTSIYSIIDFLEQNKKMIIIFVLPQTKAKLKYELLNNKFLYGYIDQNNVHITSNKAMRKEKITKQNNKQYFICNGKYSHNFDNILMYFYTNYDHYDVDLFKHMQKISDLWSIAGNNEKQQSDFRDPEIST